MEMGALKELCGLFPHLHRKVYFTALFCHTVFSEVNSPALSYHHKPSLASGEAEALSASNYSVQTVVYGRPHLVKALLSFALSLHRLQ